MFLLCCDILYCFILNYIFVLKSMPLLYTGLSRNSILRFELGAIAWTATGFPSGITPWSEASRNEDGERMRLKVRLRGNVSPPELLCL